MTLTNDEGRALPDAAPHVISDNYTTTSIERCRRCGHPLSAVRSVRLGIGPICHKAEVGEVMAC